MYNDFYYIYEAKSFIEGTIGFTIPEGFDVLLTAISVILGLAAFVLVLFTAITVKRARPFGVIAALAQPVGFVTAMLGFISYAKIDFNCLVMTVTGNSQSDAMNKLYEAMGEAFMENIAPQLVIYMLFALVYQVTTIITLIYYIMLSGAPRGKAFGIMALVLTVIRLLAITGPIEPITILLQMSSFEIQVVWNALFNILFFLPTLLVALQGIINLVANIKKKKSDAIAAAVDADPAPVETAEE